MDLDHSPSVLDAADVGVLGARLGGEGVAEGEERTGLGERARLDDDGPRDSTRLGGCLLGPCGGAGGEVEASERAAVALDHCARLHGDPPCGRAELVDGGAQIGEKVLRVGERVEVELRRRRFGRSMRLGSGVLGERFGFGGEWVGLGGGVLGERFGFGGEWVGLSGWGLGERFGLGCVWGGLGGWGLGERFGLGGEWVGLSGWGLGERFGLEGGLSGVRGLGRRGLGCGWGWFGVAASEELALELAELGLELGEGSAGVVVRPCRHRSREPSAPVGRLLGWIEQV
jgi:hypothetical protein